MAHIDYFLATLSPWVYLAGDRLEAIAARHGATITYRPVDPQALFARTGGKPLAERGAERQAYRAQELIRWADHLGMALNPRPAHFPVNPAPSAYAVIAAQEQGGNVGALVQGFARAVWAEDRDIADDAVIRDILAANGFDPGLADSGLFIGAETYGRNLEAAVQAGVFGVPFYVVRDSDARFWGQDRLDFLDKHLGAA